MQFYRDNDRDALLDLDESSVETSIIGANIHHASTHWLSDIVGKWSAGCQVVQDIAHFTLLMALADKAVDRWGNSLSYTLLVEQELY